MNVRLLLKQSGSSIRDILVFVDSSFYRLCLAKPWAIPICQEKEQILIIQRRNVGSVVCGGEQAPASEFQGLFPEFCPNPSWILIPARSCSRQSPKTESKFLKEHYTDFWRGQTSSFHLCTWKVINWIMPEYSVWVIKIVSSQGGPPLVMKFRRADYLLDFASLTQMPGYQLPVPREQSHSEIRRWQPALISPSNTLMCHPSSKLPDGCSGSEKRLC